MTRDLPSDALPLAHNHCDSTNAESRITNAECRMPNERQIETLRIVHLQQLYDTTTPASNRVLKLSNTFIKLIYASYGLSYGLKYLCTSPSAKYFVHM